MVSNSFHLILIHQAFCKNKHGATGPKVMCIQTKARKLPDKGNELRFTKHIMCRHKAKGTLKWISPFYR